MQRKVDIRSGAAMAGVSYNRFMRELQEHNVVILEDDYFLENLGKLAEAFNDEALRKAAAEVSRRVSGETNNEKIHSLQEAA